MRALRVILTLWLTIVVFGIASDYRLSKEVVGTYLIVLGLGFLSTLVHELGHAALGWKLDYKIRRIGVLPFEFDLDRRRFAMARSSSKQDIAGYVVAELPVRTSAGKRALFALGGPLAEASLALVLWAGLSVQRTAPGDVISGLMSMLAVMAFGSSLLNLLPIGGSDGALVLKCLMASGRSGKSQGGA